MRKVRREEWGGVMVLGMNVLELMVILLIQLIPFALVIVLVVLAIRWFIRQEREAKRPELKAERASLGEVVRARREACGMTQELVAQKLGVSRQAVGKWESGKSEPSTTNLMALAELFGTDAAELLREVKR